MLMMLPALLFNSFGPSVCCVQYVRNMECIHELLFHVQVGYTMNEKIGLFFTIALPFILLCATVMLLCMTFFCCF
jgi:hypothetical protein